jgi:hypothetical protein
VLERNYSSQQTEGNRRGQQGQKPTLYSVAELVLGIKTAGILHQPFPPAEGGSLREPVLSRSVVQSSRMSLFFNQVNQKTESRPSWD